MESCLGNTRKTMEDKHTILIVDDQSENIDLLEAYLAPQGYQIVKAASGEEALEKLAENRIDLVLLDVLMPGMNGFEVIIRIRQDDTNRLLPIILVTALRAREDRIKGIEVGCDIFITKPIDKIELLAWVGSLLKVKAYNDLMGNYRKELEIEVGRRTEELRNLAVHLLHAREEERKMVAREIHDELGQILAALKMDLQWIEKRYAQSTTQVMEKIHDVVGLADKTIQMVHRISSELRPGILDDLGLAAAIEWLGADFSRRNGIPCRVDFTASESRIGEKGATVLFRIVQEALINVERHALASRASVELWEEDRILTIRVQDDGIGVTEAQSMSPSAFGLIGIRERVQGLQGKMAFSGQPEKGSILLVTIPLLLEGALA
jgi:signal transduction histidine kinase